MPRIYNVAAFALTASLALVLLSTCGKDSPTRPQPPTPQPPTPQPPPPAPVATRIAVTPSPFAFASLGQVQQLTAVVYDQNGTVMPGVAVSWTSGDTNVVTVTGQGSVRAVGIGSTQITAKSGGASATIPVSVAQEAASIRITPAMVGFGAVGRQQQLAAAVFDGNRNEISGAAVAWSSNRPSVATVTDDGLVTAVSNGMAQITATYGRVSMTVTVTVSQAAESVTILPMSARLASIGETIQLTATVEDGEGNEIQDAAVSWSSGDPMVASVDNEGLVTAVGGGMTDVSAALGVASASIPVAVMQEIAALEVAPETAALVVGDTLQMSVRVTDALGVVVDNADVTWSSSVETVAIVDPEGLVLAVGEGSVTITTAAGDLTAEAHLEVAPLIPTALQVYPESLRLVSLGEIAELSAEVRDQRNRSMPDVLVSWSTGDPAVAEVDEAGRVISVGEGETEITVHVEDLSATVPVVVEQVVAALSISTVAAEMVLGDTLRIQAQARDALDMPVTSATIDWTSSNESVAFVNSEGLVSAVGEGMVDITVSAGSVSIAVRITVSHQDRPLLAALYNALNGPDWNTQTNWLSSEPLDYWHGVTIGDDHRVSALNLSNNNLSGALPPVLGQLSGLQGLALNGNSLTGSVPPELGMLTALTHLYLYENQLSGEIPPELGQLVNLVHLCLDRNQLTGSLPAELGRLTNLLWLHLYYNIELTGPLPASFTDLRLDALLLQGTQLCVPDEPGFVAWLEGIADSRVSICGRLDSDREALVALYHATRGTDWNDNTNWLSEKPLNNWFGVVTDANGRVTQLRLGSNNLNGTLPGELGQLSFLTDLHIGSNGLTGELPSEISNLAALEQLRIGNNLMTGPIPAELGQLKSLTAFSAYDNHFTGAIPPEIGQLSNLRFLTLPNNELTGEIPPELGRNTELSWLQLDRNALTGVIPPELGGLSSLRGLFLGSNQLTGGIPPELGNLTGLAYLELGWNELTGIIPPQLGGLQKLERLQVNSNRLTGVLPPELGQLSNLESLVLSFNLLNGRIPYAYGNLKRLRVLWISNNTDLRGPLPREFLDFENIESIEFGGTQVCAPNDEEFNAWLAGLRNKTIALCDGSGSERGLLTVLYHATGGPAWDVDTNWQTSLSLDQWYGVTTDEHGRVIALDLSDNNLAGEIPRELASLSYLRSLRLENNADLAGPLPVEFTGLRLESLLLAGTGLCAPSDEAFQQWLLTVPDRQILPCAVPADRDALIALYKNLGGARWRNNTNWLGGRPLSQWHGVTTNPEGRVVGLNLDNNNLVGTIHPFAGSLGDLEEMRLGSNRISGTIPSSLGDLADLRVLVLSGNRLEGGIPPALGGLASLELLDLSTNRLAGGIPTEIEGLASLAQINLARNVLSGSIPSSIGGLSVLRELLLDTNNLSGEIPASLGRLSTLESLNLARNRLSGGIPATFGSLGALRKLDVSENSGMAGALPSETLRLELDLLYLQGSNICVPQHDRFPSWYEGIPMRNGANCPPAFRVLTSLVQATQTLVDPVPLVAGRPALLRVFLTTDSGVANMPPIRVTFFEAGTEIHRVEIAARGDIVPGQIDESALGNSANAIVPGEVIVPGLELVVEVDPDETLGPGTDVGGRFPETGRSSVDVQEIQALELTLVPLLWEPDPDYSVVLGTTGLSGDDELFHMTRDLLPMGDFDLAVRDPLWTSVDPIAKSDRSDVLFRELGAARTLDGSSRHYIGVLHRFSGPANFNVIAEQPGYLSLGFVHDRIIAHALGHNMNLGHADCGFGYRLANFPGYDYPHEDGAIGSWGYDLRTNRLISPDAPDLMTNCWPSWISDFHFRKAMRYRLSDEELPVRITPNSADAGRSLMLWGGLESSGDLVLEPAFVVDAPATLPGFGGLGGPYRISGEDTSGNVLFDLSFDMPATNDTVGGAFAFTVPFRSDWSHQLSRITLTGPEGFGEMTKESENEVALILDSDTGQVRGFLRDTANSDLSRRISVRDSLYPGMDIVISRGVPDMNAWKR